MASFDEWYDWAVGQGDDWRKVAGNARRDARYEKPDSMQSFQDDVGKSFPSVEDAYGKVCLRHHLRGEQVAEEHLPPYLTRMVAERYVKYALERVLGGEALTNAVAVPRDTWKLAAELLPSRENEDDPLFVPADVVDEEEPEKRAVFATFEETDLAPVDDKPQPGFLDRVNRDHGAWGTAADYAVLRLATEDRPASGKPVSTKVLLHYPHADVGEARFPVPADANWHPRFRAITAADPHYCGRTFPDGADPQAHAEGTAGENEVVHKNRGIPCSRVYVISLGGTSCAAD